MAKSSWAKVSVCKLRPFPALFNYVLMFKAGVWIRLDVTNVNVICRGPGLYVGEYEKIEGNG